MSNKLMADILAKVKKSRESEVQNNHSIVYDAEKQQKDLEYIDKFLKVISDNSRITISYANVDTAFINMNTHEITLPNYIVRDRDLYILMGSHEVSHALHTPTSFYKAHNESSDEPVVDGIKVNRNLFMCINIVEDIRIEKLIRKKFPGFVKVYEEGYRKLLDKNPNFQVTAESWEEAGIHNRINIKAKGGDEVPFELEGKALELYNEFILYNTFDEVLKGAAKLYREMLLEKDEKKKGDKGEGDNEIEECNDTGDTDEISDLLDELNSIIENGYTEMSEQAPDDESEDESFDLLNGEGEDAEGEAEEEGDPSSIQDNPSESFSKKLLEDINDAVDGIEDEVEESQPGITDFDPDVMEESEEIAEDELKSLIDGSVAVLSATDNNVLKRLSVNPMCGIVIPK